MVLTKVAPESLKSSPGDHHHHDQHDRSVLCSKACETRQLAQPVTSKLASFTKRAARGSRARAVRAPGLHFLSCRTVLAGAGQASGHRRKEMWPWLLLDGPSPVCASLQPWSWGHLSLRSRGYTACPHLFPVLSGTQTRRAPETLCCQPLVAGLWHKQL